MSAPEIPTINDEDLQAETTVEDGKFRTNLVGSADTRAMSALDDMLKKLHAQAVERSFKEVVIDMRKLEFMNSSCFKAFVSWVTTVQELDPDRQYRIRILSDESKHWQRRSLGALACFAVDLIGIET
jgi:hypothetical protein